MMAHKAARFMLSVLLGLILLTFLGGPICAQLDANITPGTLKWRFSRWGFYPPALGVDGSVYYASESCLFCLNPATGTVNWARSLGYHVVSMPVIARDGTIFVTVKDNLGNAHVYLCSLDPAGNVNWKRPYDLHWYSQPALGADGSVYIFGNTGTGSGLYAIDPVDGSIQWIFQDIHDQTPRESPVIGRDGTVYVGMSNEGIDLSLIHI